MLSLSPLIPELAGTKVAEEPASGLLPGLSIQQLQRPLKLQNSVQPYAWGTTDVLPWLLGVANPTGQPQAEIWVGAHPKAPSWVNLPSGSVPLDRVIQAEPQLLLGSSVVAHFGHELPFLFKILSAGSPLSIQVHPNKLQAQQGFLREEQAGIPLAAGHRNYKDPNHKPELISALTPFAAMVGFRPIGEMINLLQLLGVKLFNSWILELEARGLEALEPFYQWVLELPADEVRRTLAAAAPSIKYHKQPALLEMARLARAYPGDSGAFAPLLLNLVYLNPGESLFLPARTPHAYLRGTGVEVMACSDNVLRAGLTDKHVDKPELLATVEFAIMYPQVLRPDYVGIEQEIPIPVADFRLSFLRPDGQHPFSVGGQGEIELLYGLRGQMTLTAADGETWSLGPADALLLPASSDGYTLSGKGKLAWARVNQ